MSQGSPTEVQYGSHAEQLPPRQHNNGQLAFTGYDAAGLGLFAAALIATGFGVRRLSRRDSDASS